MPQFVHAGAGARVEGRNVDIREDKAWLLQSRSNPFRCPALALGDGRISFTLDEDAGDAASAGSRSNSRSRTSLPHSLRESVVAFDYALEDCAVSWPITGGGAIMIVRTPAAASGS